MSRTKEPDFLAADALPARAAASKPEFQLNLKRSLQMHPVLAAVTALLVTAALLLGGVLLKTQYQASAIFSVSPMVSSVLSPGQLGAYNDMSQFDSIVQQEVEILQRADTIEAAVRSLPQGVWRQPKEPVALAASRLRRSLKVERMGTSQQVNATLTGARAGDTREAMAALIAQFLKTVHRDEDGHASERVQLLKEEAARIQSSLDADRAAAAGLSGEFGVSRLGESDKTLIDQNITDLRQQLSDLQKARSYAAAGLQQPSGGSNNNNDESNANITTAGLINQINARKAQLQSQMAGMTAANPILKQDVEEMRSLDRELSSARERGDAEQLRRQQAERDRAISGVSREEAQVQRQLAAETGLAVSAAAKLQHYSALNSEITLLQARLGTVREAISTTQLQANSPSRVTLDVAPTDSAPAVSTKRRMVLLAAIPLGLLAGLLAAVLAQRQDQRVFIAIDLEQVLGIKPMAVLPVDAEVSDALADQGLLRMAGSIEAAYRKNASKTFVFTASSPDSQVEELVFRVQGKLKELGYSALWLGAETLLRAERDFEVMYGRGPADVGGMLFTEARRNGKGADGIAIQRLNWLKGDYDMVLIDAPPLLTSALTEYAVRQADATILVSESGVTTREELVAAADLLEQLGANGIGAVLQELQMRYASPEYKRRQRKAEELVAQPAAREPHDNRGAWQTLNAGTSDELHVPGDPSVRRAVPLMRRTSAMHRTVNHMHEHDTAHWDETSARLVDEAAYTTGRD